MNAVILIPYRRQNDERERNLQAVLRWYEPLGWPVTLGDSGHERFNRAASRNAAAAGAGDWDVALISDADCVAELEVVRYAASEALETGKLILPHDDFWRMTQRGTPALVADLEFFRAQPERARRLSDRMVVIERNKMPSGALLVTRESFTRIGGYDEALAWWGYEDSVFLKDAEASVGTLRLPGMLWHLWHPRDTGTIDERTEQRRIANAHREAYNR